MTTTHTPQKRLTVLRHLAGGKAPDVVAAIVALDRTEVIDIAGDHGYPDRDKMAKAARPGEDPPRPRRSRRHPGQPRPHPRRPRPRAASARRSRSRGAPRRRRPAPRL